MAPDGLVTKGRRTADEANIGDVAFGVPAYRDDVDAEDRDGVLDGGPQRGGQHRRRRAKCGGGEGHGGPYLVGVVHAADRAATCRRRPSVGRPAMTAPGLVGHRSRRHGTRDAGEKCVISLAKSV